MEFLTTKQASELWKISPRRIAILCEQERIAGAIKAGKTWLLPIGSQKPEDARLSTDSEVITLEKGVYYQKKIEENHYQLQLQKCIEDACRFCLETVAISDTDEVRKNQPLMLLGKIQSGKTRAFTGLMALAFDNNFDMALILTKNSQALVTQTYKRMRLEFKAAIAENEIEVFDIMKAIDGLTDYELNKKIIIIAKKEKRNLERIASFISDYAIQHRKNCLIIDDEADTTGIGFSRVKNTDDEFDLRTVASKVNEVRGSLDGCVFVQVTATPYALYLQPDFNESIIEPIKPKHTVLVPSGDGYIGGEYYFIQSKDDDHPARFIFEPVSEEENALVSDQKRNGKKSKINDRRSFKEENILTERSSLEVFKKGIMNFIVGGCVLAYQGNKRAHYSYIIHTATQKSSHIKLDSITREFIKQIKERDESTIHIIEAMFSEAYYDIERSVIAYENQMPAFDDIRAAFFRAVDNDYVSITIVNSDKDMDSVLDEDTGELRLRTPFSIFVGGQVLDRGVTIPRMIGFYYGRNPKTMQQDTVMQHSRMFGYRGIDLLSVTRFYTTRRIHENMTKITEFDAALREDIENNTFGNGIVFIQKYLSYKNNTDGTKTKDEIIPCAPEKIALSNLVLIKPESRLLPVGFTPVAKTYAARISKEVNKALIKIMPEDVRDSRLVAADDLEAIVELLYSALTEDDDSGRFVDMDRFLSAMRYLARADGKVHLIVRRNRQISKYKKNGTSLQDAPDTPRDELALAKSVAVDNPALMLLHQDGTGNGWNGSEFWWPVLLAQKNAGRTIFAMPNPDGRVKNDEEDC